MDKRDVRLIRQGGEIDALRTENTALKAEKEEIATKFCIVRNERNDARAAENALRDALRWALINLNANRQMVPDLPHLPPMQHIEGFRNACSLAGLAPETMEAQDD